MLDILFVIMVIMVSGFISIYGKYSLWILLRKWIIIVLGVERLFIFLLNKVNVSSSFRFGFGLEVIIKKMDLLLIEVCCIFSG